MLNKLSFDLDAKNMIEENDKCITVRMIKEKRQRTFIFGLDDIIGKNKAISFCNKMKKKLCTGLNIKTDSNNSNQYSFQGNLVDKVIDELINIGIDKSIIKK